MLRLTNHSSTVYRFNVPAEALHYQLFGKARELGLTTRGGVANVVVFSPPYANSYEQYSDYRGFRNGEAGRMKSFTKGNHRAFINAVISSAYIILRRHGKVVVVIKDTTTNGNAPQTVEEAMRFVGFNDVETHRFMLKKPSSFAEYHKTMGHRYEHLLYEYVVVGTKREKQVEESGEAVEEPETEEYGEETEEETEEEQEEYREEGEPETPEEQGGEQ